MFHPYFASGEHIYRAALAGAKRKYNRSFRDSKKCEDFLKTVYEHHIALSPQSEQRSLRKNTNSNWREAYLPVDFYAIHYHRAFQPCEPHMRLGMRTNGPHIFFDIPMEYWAGFVRGEELMAAAKLAA